MILGIGVDIVRTARFAEISAKSPHRLIRLQQRILHPSELARVENNNVVRHLASSWAAKEALYKSLNPVQQKACVFNQWKREFTPRGQEMKCDMPAFNDQEILVSISHDGEYTVAYVLRQPKFQTERVENAQ